ncbi:MAG: 4Fe-4S single cluster domain-containing protein [Luteimonas sp.]
MSVTLGLSRVHFPVTTLGPGRRLGIWFQGCSIRCPGCISADTWGPGRQRVSLPQLIESITPALDTADGVTISGGEPFDQPEALIALLQALRARHAGDILVYSGHPMERLAPLLARAENLIDALICDPYDQAAPQSLPLRGSDNQRLHLLTARGHACFAAFDAARPDDHKVLDVMFDDDGTVWMAGIPRRGDLQQLQALLQAQGHRVQTSAHDSGRRRAR